MSLISVSQLRGVSVAETLTSEDGIVDLWYYFYEGIDSGLRSAHEAILNPIERDQFESLRFEHDRHLFLATRVLVRSVLSNYSAVSPADWRFVLGDHGKPLIGGPTVTPAIHFNLANTPGLVACAVSVAHELVGVDAERIDRKVDAVELADRYFSKFEASKLRALPSSERLGRFFSYWTLKESYLKARGLGLHLALNQMSFVVEDEISVVFNGRLDDDTTSWRFAVLDAPPHHTIAVGVKTGGAALSLRAAQFVPLGRNAGSRESS
jgi:4'-phosphopantetheinyl transferase